MTMGEGAAAGTSDVDEGSLIWQPYGALTTDAGGLAEKVGDDAQQRPGGGSSRQLLLLCVQVFCMAAVGGYCLYAITLDPVAVGFFCNDDSIRFPLLKQTVPTTEALLIVILFPLVFMLLVDWLAVREFRDRLVSSTPVDLGCCRVPALMRAYYRSIGGFAFAMACAYAVTITGKICIGRLRPHFLAACLPDWAQIRCSNSTGFLYVDRFQCTSGNAAAIKEARMSFPSGHSSSAMCAMVYLVLFLQSRLVWLNDAAAPARQLRPPVSSSTKVTRALWRTLRGFCPFVQLLAFAVAFFIGLSRIRDRYHHPSDVLCGFCVGFLAALYAAFYIAGFGSCRRPAEYGVQKSSVDLAV